MMMRKPPLIPLLIYRSLLWLLTPYILWRTRREGRRYHDERYAPQRCGQQHPRFADNPVWFHAASVGEVNALLPLIEALHRERPELPLLLTSNTASSGAIARDRLPAGVVHGYLPLDWPEAMQHFLAQTQPRLGVIMETELWPNLYRLCSEGGTPLVIVNGRVSAKTLNAPQWLRRLYRDTLRRTAQILTRSDEDRERFIQLGAPIERSHMVGNIKFATLNSEPPAAIELGRDYVLAASSRDGEERLIVEAWQRSGREELLVIAPRHPQRLAAILSELKPFGLTTEIRSKGEQPNAETQLYIADTFGELRGLMAGAELVFMGGSLVARGGHNLLEPAALGKAVITGPYMENFSEETETLLQGKGLLQVQSVEELGAAFASLLQDEKGRRLLGERAKETLAQHADVVGRYLEAIQAYL